MPIKNIIYTSYISTYKNQVPSQIIRIFIQTKAKYIIKYLNVVEFTSNVKKSQFRSLGKYYFWQAIEQNIMYIIIGENYKT